MSAPPADPEDGPTAFVAFAGGGARGLVHVGALRALEDKAVTVRGYAGASAGAIVACLAAAGLSSKQLLDPHSSHSLIDEVRRVDDRIRSLPDLFGRGGWVKIRALRTGFSLFARTPTSVRGFGAALATLVAIVATLGAQAVFGLWGGVGALCVWATLVALVIYAAIGLVRLTTLRRALSRYLKARVFGDVDAPDEVTFAAFDGVRAGPGGRPLALLKIVASNITTRRLELFSCDTTPDVAVADAVCASVCIPFVFAPWRIGGQRYVDGGLVSNFPAWPFDEERALDPDALTIGFQIGPLVGARPPAGPHARDRPVFWPSAVIETALFATRQLSIRAVGHAELITLPARLGLLDFDLRPDAARGEVEDVYTFALTEIDNRLFRFPAIYRSACAQVALEVGALLEDDASVLRVDPGVQGWVRCAVAMPPSADARRSLATLYGVGYDDFADGDLVWPIAGSLAGAAWTSRSPQFELDPIGRDAELVGREFASLRRRLPADLAWSLRVPILTRRTESFLVVLVDGSDALQNTVAMLDIVEALIDRIDQVFRPVAKRFEEA